MAAEPAEAVRAYPFVLSSADEEHSSIRLRIGTTVLCRHRSVADTHNKSNNDPDTTYIGLSDCGVDNNHLQYLSRKHAKITCLANGAHTVTALTTKQHELQIVRVEDRPLVLNQPAPIAINQSLVLLGDATRHDLNELRYRLQPTAVDLSGTAAEAVTQPLEIVSDDEPSSSPSSAAPPSSAAASSSASSAALVSSSASGKARAAPGEEDGDAGSESNTHPAKRRRTDAGGDDDPTADFGPQSPDAAAVAKATAE
eukprot:CAMPEP_0119520380 /NCGR_PEP_ID=MMETSP1344-20130328/36416_1 /TAXON_ID=236787 /ORGANISM="Florenciella parvula, Strain CCMP2471" /LENGTH=254 /DNA_ID=CAMNT_0007558261 /DNA_START=185 /DNA_END=946 /DNA_ORIENTATION=+